MIAGTSDRPHGDRPSGSGNVHTETNDPNVYSNPLEYLWCGGEQDEK